MRLVTLFDDVNVKISCNRNLKKIQTTNTKSSNLRRLTDVAGALPASPPFVPPATLEVGTALALPVASLRLQRVSGRDAGP